MTWLNLGPALAELHPSSSFRAFVSGCLRRPPLNFPLPAVDAEGRLSSAPFHRCQHRIRAGVDSSHRDLLTLGGRIGFAVAPERCWCLCCACAVLCWSRTFLADQPPITATIAHRPPTLSPAELLVNRLEGLDLPSSSYSSRRPTSHHLPHPPSLLCSVLLADRPPWLLPARLVSLFLPVRRPPADRRAAYEST